MIREIVSAKYLCAHKVECVFDDGTRGIVDFSRHLSLGGVFDNFHDLDFFRNFKVDREIGTLVWGDGLVDVAPETLYEAATKQN
jgi:hypothetical protein